MSFKSHVEEILAEVIDSALFWSESVADSTNAWLLEASGSRRRWSDARMCSCLREGWAQQFRPVCGAHAKRAVSLRGETFVSVTPRLVYFTDENRCRLALKMSDGSKVYFRVASEDVMAQHRPGVHGAMDVLRLTNLYVKTHSNAAIQSPWKGARSQWTRLVESVLENLLTFLDSSSICAFRLSSREGNACFERSPAAVSRYYCSMFRWVRPPPDSEVFSWFARHPFVHPPFEALEHARIAARILSVVDVSDPRAPPLTSLLRSVQGLLPFYQDHTEYSQVMVRVAVDGSEFAALSCNVDCVNAVVDRLLSYRWTSDSGDTRSGCLPLVSLWYDPFVECRDTSWSPLNGGLFFVRYRTSHDFASLWLTVRDEVLAIASKQQLHAAM